MNLSPVEAINRVNDSVTVEMLVQRTKCCTGSRQVFLDSEANCHPTYSFAAKWRHIVLPEIPTYSFAAAGETGYHGSITMSIP